jgi:hypothetical protein
MSVRRGRHSTRLSLATAPTPIPLRGPFDTYILPGSSPVAIHFVLFGSVCPPSRCGPHRVPKSRCTNSYPVPEWHVVGATQSPHTGTAVRQFYMCVSSDATLARASEDSCPLPLPPPPQMDLPAHEPGRQSSRGCPPACWLGEWLVATLASVPEGGQPLRLRRHRKRRAASVPTPFVGPQDATRRGGH